MPGLLVLLGAGLACGFGGVVSRGGLLCVFGLLTLDLAFTAIEGAHFVCELEDRLGGLAGVVVGVFLRRQRDLREVLERGEGVLFDRCCVHALLHTRLVGRWKGRGAEWRDLARESVTLVKLAGNWGGVWTGSEFGGVNGSWSARRLVFVVWVVLPTFGRHSPPPQGCGTPPGPPC